MKRLPVFLLVAALLLALVAGSTALPRFVNAQDATPAAPNLPAQRPTISAALPDATTVEGTLEESCWPQSSPDQQLCTFASDSTPTQTITLTSDQAVTFSVTPADPPPSTFEALVYLPTGGEAALTIDLSAVQGKLEATALPAGSSSFLVAVIASYSVADGGEYYVRSNFKVSSDAGTAVIATAEATTAATTEATIVVSAPTAETPSAGVTEAAATPEATAEIATAEVATAEVTASTSGLVTATPLGATTEATVVAPTAEVVATEAATAEGTAVPTQAMSVAEEATMLAQTRNAAQPATTSAGTPASGTTGAASATLPPPTATKTLTPTNTATFTNTPTATNTATFTPTFTFTPTPTNTATFTNTPTPTSTFTSTPTPTNTPLAPELRIRVGGRDFLPIRMTVSFTGDQGDAVTVSRAVREGSFRVSASPADAAQILFTGPRPASINVTLLSSDGLTVVNTQTLTPDNLVLYTMPSEVGSYVVAIEVQFTQLGSVRATYYFRLVVGS